MGHSTTTLCLACNAALTLASILLFGNETTSSISHGLCAGEFSLIGPRPIKVERRDGEDRLIWKDAGKNGYGGPQNCPCWKEKGCFGRRTMKGRDILQWIIFLWASDLQQHTKMEMTHKFLPLVIYPKFACDHSISYCSFTLFRHFKWGTRKNELRRMTKKKWNKVKWNKRHEQRARRYSPLGFFKQWMWKQMRVISLPQQF